MVSLESPRSNTRLNLTYLQNKEDNRQGHHKIDEVRRNYNRDGVDDKEKVLAKYITRIP
eukprot:Awhi_evm2s11528